MKRYPNWPQILETEIARAARRRFAWGKWDCALFAANVVRAMTGEDPAKAYRGRYKTEVGSRRALKRYGGGTLRRATTRALGAPLASVKKAQRGDVVLFKTLSGQTLGIVDLDGINAVAMDHLGVGRRPLREAVAAWRIGA